MVDWKTYKGEGPWEFTKSPPKNHYNEGSHISNVGNPVWDINRVSPSEPVTPEHDPHCGYWPSLEAPPPPPPGGDANIFGLFESGAMIYGCYWDGVSSLTFTSIYDPNDGKDLNGLVLIDDTLITVAGTGATASLKEVGTTPAASVLPLVDEHFPFNDYDVTRPERCDLLRDPDTGDIFYGDGAIGSVGGTLVKINSSYVKELRSYIGTVFTGTDGNLWYGSSVFAAWDPVMRPITGNPSFYNGFFNQIPDNNTDGSIRTWGVGSLLSCIAIEFRMKLYEGTLHAALAQSSLPYDLRVYSTSTLGVTAFWHANQVPYDFVVYNDHIYTVEGNFGCTLVKYNLIYQVQDSVVLTPGRADEIIEMSGSLIVLNDPYTATNQLFKINPSTLAVIDQYDFPSGDLWQRIAAIDERYLFIGGNNDAMVFDIVSWAIVDTVAISGAFTGWSTRDVVVQNL